MPLTRTPAPRWQFVYVIRKRIKLEPEKAIFIFVDEVLPPTGALMSTIYEEHKSVPFPPACSLLTRKLIGGLRLQGRGRFPVRRLLGRERLWRRPRPPRRVSAGASIPRAYDFHPVRPVLDSRVLSFAFSVPPLFHRDRRASRHLIAGRVLSFAQSTCPPFLPFFSCVTWFACDSPLIVYYDCFYSLGLQDGGSERVPTSLV